MQKGKTKIYYVYKFLHLKQLLTKKRQEQAPALQKTAQGRFYYLHISIKALIISAPSTVSFLFASKHILSGCHWTPKGFAFQYPSLTTRLKTIINCFLFGFVLTLSSSLLHIKKQKHHKSGLSAFGLSGETWTPGLLNPIQARYQTALHPDNYYIMPYLMHFVNSL